MIENELLGFIILVENEAKDGYLGAILIIDQSGVPQGFRVTFPVKPTLVQKTIYGDSLESYIGVEMCGIPLRKSVNHS